MTLHICRDLRERINSDDNHGLYWLAIFLRYVLGFTVVGQTNFDIEGSTLKKGSGSSARINIGTLNEYAVDISTAEYVLSGADVDRILVLKSTTNPTKNSGLFRITSVDHVNNRLFIDYGSPGFPPAESSLSWVICEIETRLTFNTSGNAVSGGYRSNGSAACSRIILQSPHSTGWQVRLCRESSTDVSNGLPESSVAPGFGGDAAGDFAVGGEHLHQFLWRNQSNTTYRHTVVGVDRDVTTNMGRVYIWGDDSTGSVVFINRDCGGSKSLWLSFGLTENEDIPLPPRDIQRLFVLGMHKAVNTSINFTSDFGVSWMGGSGFGLGRMPISACMSSYAKLATQTSVASGARFSSAASDNMFTLQTEILNVDVVVGTYDNYDSSFGESVLTLEARRLGTVPYVRQGRSLNIGNWTASSDKQWIHIMNGVWLPWCQLGTNV
jgi:hypothetical protein